jgi:hypothetical protein
MSRTIARRHLASQVEPVQGDFHVKGANARLRARLPLEGQWTPLNAA